MHALLVICNGLFNPWVSNGLHMTGTHVNFKINRDIRKMAGRLNVDVVTGWFLPNLKVAPGILDCDAKLE